MHKVSINLIWITVFQNPGINYLITCLFSFFWRNKEALTISFKEEVLQKTSGSYMNRHLIVFDLFINVMIGIYKITSYWMNSVLNINEMSKQELKSLTSLDKYFAELVKLPEVVLT